MSPSIVTIDNTPDFEFGGGSGNPAPTSNITPSNIAATSASQPRRERTLLLAPPSVASDGPEAVAFAAGKYGDSDLQMLDRLAAGLVTLPADTYSLVLLMTEVDGSRHAEATALLSRDVFAAVSSSMVPFGQLMTQDGTFHEKEIREAVLGGLVQRDNGKFEKPVYEEAAVPLRFGKKKNNNVEAKKEENGSAHSSAGPAVSNVKIDVYGKQTTLDMVPPAVKALPAGVAFDFGDDLDDDDELIDENELMTEEDMNRPIQVRT